MARIVDTTWPRNLPRSRLNTGLTAGDAELTFKFGSELDTEVSSFFNKIVLPFPDVDGPDARRSRSAVD